MKPMHSIARARMLAPVFVLLLTVSCSTRSRLLTSWELPSPDIGPFEKVTVVAITQDDRSGRAFELAATREIEKHGIDAVPGYSVIDNIEGGDPSLQEMESQLNKTGADAVLIFKVISVDADHKYVPPTTYTTSGAPYPEWWDDPYWGYYTPYPYHYWGYWHSAVQVTRSPGYWEISKTYRIETVLYRLTDNRLVWTAVSETYDPASHKDVARSLSEEVLQRLDHAGLVSLNLVSLNDPPVDFGRRIFGGTPDVRTLESVHAAYAELHDDAAARTYLSQHATGPGAIHRESDEPRKDTPLR